MNKKILIYLIPFLILSLLLVCFVSIYQKKVKESKVVELVKEELKKENEELFIQLYKYDSLVITLMNDFNIGKEKINYSLEGIKTSTELSLDEQIEAINTAQVELYEEMENKENFIVEQENYIKELDGNIKALEARVNIKNGSNIWKTKYANAKKRFEEQLKQKDKLNKALQKKLQEVVVQYKKEEKKRLKAEQEAEAAKVAQLKAEEVAYLAQQAQYQAEKEVSSRQTYSSLTTGSGRPTLPIRSKNSQRRPTSFDVKRAFNRSDFRLPNKTKREGEVFIKETYVDNYNEYGNYWNCSIRFKEKYSAILFKILRKERGVKNYKIKLNPNGIWEMIP